MGGIAPGGAHLALEGGAESPETKAPPHPDDGPVDREDLVFFQGGPSSASSRVPHAVGFPIFHMSLIEEIDVKGKYVVSYL